MGEGAMSGEGKHKWELLELRTPPFSADFHIQKTEYHCPDFAVTFEIIWVNIVNPMDLLDSSGPDP